MTKDLLKCILMGVVIGITFAITNATIEGFQQKELYAKAPKNLQDTTKEDAKDSAEKRILEEELRKRIHEFATRP